MNDSWPKQDALKHDGLEISWLDWGGDGDPLVLLHPNGFCAGIYDPLAKQLKSSFRVVAVDLRAVSYTHLPLPTILLV